MVWQLRSGQAESRQDEQGDNMIQPALFYHVDDLKRRKKKGTDGPPFVWMTLRQIAAMFERHRIAVKKAMKFPWDNGEWIILDSRGHPALCVQCTWQQRGGGCLSLWTISGYALGHWDHIPEDLEEMANQAGLGQFRCSDCGKWFPLTTVKQYGFAGSACQKCYNPKKHLQPDTRGD